MTKEELGELIIASTDDFYRVAKSILRINADCEDAVQEAIIKAFAKIGTLREDRFAKTWFTRILINECYRILRRRQRETVYEEEIGNQEMEEKNWSDLYQKMMALDMDYRVPIVLYYMNQYSIKEIGMMLDLKESTVKMRLSRARKMLLRMYEQEGAV